MPRRLIVLSLLAALSAFSTGCCGRIRQCIANRWNAHHPYGGYGYGYGGACCTPAYKMAAPVGCSTCGPDGGAAVVYQGQPLVTPIPAAGVPNIGAPMPLLGSGSSAVPSTMPPK